METVIEDKLKEIDNFSVKVQFLDFRKYEVSCKIEKMKEFKITYLYDVCSTMEYNISNICEKINFEIINLFRKV